VSAPAGAGGSTAPAAEKRLPLPDGADIVFAAIMWFLIVLLPNFVFSDASTGWHLVSGGYTLDHLQVPRQDLNSYTFPAKPWVSWEWLFDAAAALVVRLGGLSLLAVAVASSIALLFALLYRDVRRSGCHFLIALGLTLAGALASSVHWLARPHLITFFGVYVFARWLEAFHRGAMPARALLPAVVLTMLVWTNAHPGFLYGLAMIAVYLAAESVAAIASPAGGERRRALGRAAVLAGGLVLSGAASFVNPYGAGLHAYIGAYLRRGALRNGFDEFQSPVFHGQLQTVSLEMLFGALVFGLAASRRRLWLGRLALVAIFAHLALSATRNIPLFVIVALPAAGALLAEVDPARLAGGRDRPAWLAAAGRWWRHLTQAADVMEPRSTMHLVPIATVAVLVLSCAAAVAFPGVRPLSRSTFSPKSVPTQTLAELERRRLSPDRGFSSDNWGGYLRYVTGHRVFIDDRLDFYDEDFYLRYTVAITGSPGWAAVLDAYRVEWVLVPKNVGLASMLAQAPGWRLIAQDAAADLFLREMTHGTARPHGPSGAPSDPVLR
jgi:hypothetical protein